MSPFGHTMLTTSKAFRPYFRRVFHEVSGESMAP
jgi:hypothetical protein